jgi:hypothetical protein
MELRSSCKSMAEIDTNADRRCGSRPQARPDDETRQVIYEAARHDSPAAALPRPALRWWRVALGFPPKPCIVGDHMWAAKKGLDALVVDWDEGPNARKLIHPEWLYQLCPLLAVGLAQNW